ncbi:28S ribosomal protein S34, mitochondrial [Geodia barretti]|uniref:28S ribosomal protein S34, mitochondrial n=1 Tax=Geodia barretti TaxID=519541 RepID=A0AA35SIZ3_GEOBA|nr:28S ribosomal protein S34, mitochondrial [Geodia barretti]
MSQRAAEMVQYLARQRPRKLFNVLNKLEGHGVGRKVTRTIWRQEEAGPDPVAPCYWTITRVKPDQSLRKGDVWGVLTWRGNSKVQEKKIRSYLKEQWKLLPKDL